MTRQSLLHLRVPPTEVQRHTESIRQELYAVLFNSNDSYHTLSQLRGAEQQFDLQWIRLSPDSRIAHQTIGKSEIRKRTGASVVGVVREELLKPNPDADFVLEPEDLVAIIGDDGNRERFLRLALSPPLNEDARQ